MEIFLNFLKKVDHKKRNFYRILQVVSGMHLVIKVALRHEYLLGRMDILPWQDQHRVFILDKMKLKSKDMSGQQFKSSTNLK